MIELTIIELIAIIVGTSILTYIGLKWYGRYLMKTMQKRIYEQMGKEHIPLEYLDPNRVVNGEDLTEKDVIDIYAMAEEASKES